MAERVEARLLICISHGVPEIATQCKAQMADIRRELGEGSFGDPLETLLIERIVLTWARLQYVEEQAGYTCMHAATEAQAEHWDKRLTHAQGRFLKSCMALERVRKLRRRAPMSAGAINALLGNSLGAPLRAERERIARGRTE
jgi:hypothetical protein